MKHTVVALCLLLGSLFPSFASGEDGNGKFSLSPVVNYFTWKEYDSSGERIVKESGVIYGLQGGIKGVPLYQIGRQSLQLSGDLLIYGGVVGYDGRQNLTNLPVSTNVDYVGSRLRIDAGWSMPVQESILEPFSGITYRFWLRNLQSSSAVDDRGNRVPVSGTTEYWNDISARLGVRWYDISLAPGWKLFAEGGALYPFYVSNTVDMANGVTTLEPKGMLTPFGEVGLRIKRLRFALTYEEQRYSRSSTLVVGSYFVHQPESVGEYFGFSVGYCF
jgi:hypothetical protein